MNRRTPWDKNGDTMIIEKFEEQVEGFPGKLAVKVGEQSLTYGELNDRANRVANEIFDIDKAAAEVPGNINTTIVSLLFEHGIGAIVGIIAALKAQKTYVILDVNYPPKRLTYILDHSQTYLLLTDSSNKPLAERLTAQLGKRISIININNISSETPDENIKRKALGSRPAYILYTSGSTGKPKGVVQNHDNTLYFIRNWTRRFSITGSDRITLLASLSHDGAVPDIFSALLNGAALYPYDIKKSANFSEIKDFLVQEKITIWHSVPTLYRYFTRTLTGDEKFPDIRMVVLGGEEVIEHDVSVFKTLFPRAKFANIYGQTESTVSSIWLISREDRFKRVGIGEPIGETQIFLVDDNGGVVEEMGVGEIVVASAHVALEYWQDKENSETAFTTDSDLGRLYWTGDLGRLYTDGSIAFVGRKDSQVKIRGFRVETGEIESVLLQHPAVKEAVVAVGKEKNIENYLCVYFAAGQPLTPAELKDFLAAELPDYMVPGYFIEVEKMPVTDSGKIDREALPASKPVQPAAAFETPSGEIERKLLLMWQEVLAVEKIGINSNFFELGGHSLIMMTLAAKIHKAFDVKLQVADIFDYPTIKELSRYIMGAKKTVFSSIRPAEEKEYYELSFNQRRLWLLHQLDEESISYNMTCRVALDHKVDVEAVKKTLAAMTEQHESFRTSFKEVNRFPRQFIAKPGTVDISLKVIDISSLAEKEKQEKNETFYHEIIETPFDLSHPPLFRPVLIKLAEAMYHFVFGLHHIISDAWSMDILKRQFRDFYEGYRSGKEKEEVPSVLRYRDFAQWHNRQIADTRLTGKSRQFWEEKVRGEFPLLELPADLNANKNDRKLAGYQCMLGKETAINIKRVAREHNTTLFILMFALFLLWLYRFSKQEHIACFIINVGRDHEELYNIVGFFVNAVLFKTGIDYKKPFSDFLGHVHKEVFQVFQHQAYPPELVFEAHNVKYPDINVCFNMPNIRNSKQMAEPTISKPNHSSGVREAKFDIEPYITEYKENISIYWTYRKALFTPAAIEYMAAEYARLVDFFTAAANIDKSYHDYKKTNRKYILRPPDLLYGQKVTNV